MSDRRALKSLRSYIKNIIPFCIESEYVRRTYGMYVRRGTIVPRKGVDKLLRKLFECLPYRFVMAYDQWSEHRSGQQIRGIAEKEGLFCRSWYVAANPDVCFESVDPVEHYFSIGWKENRDPSEYFSTTGYLQRYKDVMIAGVNPLAHYLLRGREEGRDTCASGPFLGGVPSWKDRLCARKRRGRPYFFSVIVASYNYEDLVLETLESIARQSYRNFEVIIVDDGSRDRSRENIKSFIEHRQNRDVPFTLYTHPECHNRGLAETVWLGVKKSRGDYVTFCESDDLWTPDHLESLSSFIEQYGAAEVIANDVEIFGDPLRVARFNVIKNLRYKELRNCCNRISARQFRNMNYLLTFSATAVKRELLLECDWHPVARPAALDWWLWRQLCFDRPVYFINRVLTRWRMHNSYMFKTHNNEDQTRTLVELQAAFTRALDGVIVRQHPFSLSAWFTMDSEKRPKQTYRFTTCQRKRFYRDRQNGLIQYSTVIKKHQNVRILVCLHLFYDESWLLIRDYLGNLAPYNVDYIVTAVDGKLAEPTITSLRDFSERIRIVTLPNVGYDIGPFAHILRNINLEDYDIVFKLQSKGIRRPRIYIYNQVFKYSDWFFNLFDGVLGGLDVHKVIDSLAEGRAKLAAAENLIVEDPPHKQFFTERFCRQYGLTYYADYRFVAGSCFAVRSEVLRPLKALNLSIDDFAAPKKGEFSLAHALERYVCMGAQDALMGIPVAHPTYPAEVRSCEASSALRLLGNPRFKIDYDFFYRVLESRPVRTYRIVDVRLGALNRYWYDGKIYPLEQCPPYRYLCGDSAAYEEYCRMNQAVTGFEMSQNRFEKLCAQMSEYDPLQMPVVLGPRNIIQDGQHRSCILLKKFGPDHIISVLRID